MGFNPFFFFRSFFLRVPANYAVRIRTAEFDVDPHLLGGLVQRTIIGDQQGPLPHGDYRGESELRGDEFEDQ